MKRRELLQQIRNFPLNTAQTDRLSFSVLRDAKWNIKKIENVSYEIYIDGNWEWVVRYDDHGGPGQIHRHFRITLRDDREIESAAEILKSGDKNYELTWVCNDIKLNYLLYRTTFLKNSDLDLY